MPEFALYDQRVEHGDLVLVAGVADAVALDEQGRIDVVVDWKSDAHPTRERVAWYRRQMRDYLLVFVTTGHVETATAPLDPEPPPRAVPQQVSRCVPAWPD